MRILIGAGGHAKVVYEALRASGTPAEAIQIRDGDPSRAGLPFLDQQVHVPELPEGAAIPEAYDVHVAIGRGDIRKQLMDRAAARGAAALSVLHPGADISDSAEIDPGAFVACRAIVAAQARVGRGAIVNHGAIVDHDCTVGAFSHIAPGAVLGGQVRVGADALIGANATVLPGLDIGASVVVGAGSIVTKSIASGQTWIGTSCLPKET